MRFSLMPILVPPVILITFAWGVHGLVTSQHDRGFSWSFTIGSAVAGFIAIALHVYTVDNRLRDLEDRIETQNKSRSKNAT